MVHGRGGQARLNTVCSQRSQPFGLVEPALADQHPGLTDHAGHGDHLIVGCGRVPCRVRQRQMRQIIGTHLGEVAGGDLQCHRPQSARLSLAWGVGVVGYGSVSAADQPWQDFREVGVPVAVVGGV